MRFDRTRLRRPEWIVGTGALVLLLSMLLLPWYSVTSISAPPGPQYLVKSSIDGWHGLSNAHWLLLATVLLALALVLFQAMNRAPAIPVTLSLLVAVLGGASTVWLVYRVLIDPPGGSRELGGFVALLGALAVTYGGYASLRLEGIAPADGPGEIAIVRLGEQRGS